MTKADKSKFDLRAAIEKNALVVIVGCVFAASSAVYAVVNGWYEREYKFKADKLEDQYKEKFAQLDSERSRITLTINTESKVISMDTVFIDPQKLPQNYSVVEGGTFAVPKIQGPENNWVWKTRSELEILGEALGPKTLAEAFPKEQQKVLENNASSHVSCYESAKTYKIRVEDSIVVVRQRAFFQRVPWEDISKMLTAENASGVQNLFDAIGKIGDNVDVWNLEEMFVTSPDFSKEKKLKFLENTDVITDQLARVGVKQPGRAAIFLDYVETHFGKDVEDRIQKSFEPKRVKLEKEEEAEKAQKKKMEEERAKEPVKIEVDKLGVFLALFSQPGVAGQASPFGKFTPTNYTFKDKMFTIQGYFDLKDVKGIQAGSITRIYFLRIGMLRDDGIYAMGYTYPADNDFTGLHQAMSLIDGVRILK
jgi:hypothetical protein